MDYVPILSNSFGLFQYYFFQLVLILPYIFLIFGLIWLFKYLFVRK